MTIQQDHAPVNEINACVERICDLGCSRVYQTIKLMEQGEAVPELKGTNEKTHPAVLEELKTIMAVYDARDGGALCKMSSLNADSCNSQ